MKFNGKLDEAEAIGFISVKGITFDVEVTAEESITFLKQILPIARELKSFRLFEVEKDNAGLCKSLNQTRDEKNEVEREYRQAKATADLEKDRLQEKVKELEEKLREAQMPQAVAQPAKKS
jgi:hypothetical protein